VILVKEFPVRNQGEKAPLPGTSLLQQYYLIKRIFNKQSRFIQIIFSRLSTAIKKIYFGIRPGELLILKKGLSDIFSERWGSDIWTTLIDNCNNILVEIKWNTLILKSKVVILRFRSSWSLFWIFVYFSQPTVITTIVVMQTVLKKLFTEFKKKLGQQISSF
jgi:hypothetical protein